MKLDISTLTFVSGVVFATQTLAVYLQYRANRRYEGLGWWLCASALVAAGFLAMPAVNVPAIHVLAAFANPLVVSGLLCLHEGVARFLGAKPGRRLSLALLGAFLAAYSYFIVDYSIFARTMLVTATIAFIAGRIAWTILRSGRAGLPGSSAFTAAVFLVYALAESAMTTITLLLPPLESYADVYREPLRVLNFIVPIVCSMLWLFGFIAMVNQRLNDENAEERRKLRMIFDTSPAAKLITRMDDGHIIDVNESFLALTGYTRQELLGQSIPAIRVWGSPEDRQDYFRRLESLGSVRNLEYRFRRKNGETFLGQISATVMDKGGAPTIIAVVNDITERNAAELQIRRLLDEKELLLREVHHRIKNNMSTVHSLLLLQAGTLGDPLAQNALKDAAGRVQSMMMLYDKLYKSGHVDDLALGDYLSPLVDEILGSFPDSGKVTVEKDFDAINLDVARLQPLGIMVNELLSNIMKYAFAGRDSGRIRVSARLEEGLVTLAIRDDGNGMPESVNFENSTGFGLVLVGALAQQLQGALRIERGGGTGVILEFRQ